MSELLRLADLCEKATAGNRLLDAKIFECLGLTPTQERHCKDWCGQNGRTDLTRAMYIEAWAPHFTGSIDAAMTLVPTATRPNGAKQEAFPRILKFSVSEWHANIGYGNTTFGQNGKSATPALALCAASLRASDTAGVR